MTKWEYMVHEDIGGGTDDVALTEHGSFGWELVSVVNIGPPDDPSLLFYFKRPLP